MSIQLDLLIPYNSDQFRFGFVDSYDKIRLTENDSVYGQLIDLSGYRAAGAIDIPEKPTIRTMLLPPNVRFVSIYREEGVVDTRSDPYGNELTFVYAKDLRQLNFPADDKRTKAAMAYVNCLDDHTPIILSWS